jgi:hypothetical protein
LSIDHKSQTLSNTSGARNCAFEIIRLYFSSFCLFDGTLEICRSQTPLAILRSYHESGNVTGRFKLYGAYCVTFFGHCMNMRIPRIRIGYFGGYRIFSLEREGLVAYGL